MATIRESVVKRRPLKISSKTHFVHLGLVLALVVLFSADNAHGQTKSGSYLAIVNWTHITLNDGGTKTCIIIGYDGQYHMESTLDPSKGNKAKLRVSTGFLPDDYFEQLKKLLESKDLIDLGNTPPPKELVVERETDVVVLRIHRSNGAQDMMYANPDGKHPVPRSVGSFVPWVKEVKNLDDMLVKDPEPNSCRSLEPTGDYLPQLVRR